MFLRKGITLFRAVPLTTFLYQLPFLLHDIMKTKSIRFFYFYFLIKSVEPLSCTATCFRLKSPVSLCLVRLEPTWCKSEPLVNKGRTHSVFIVNGIRPRLASSLGVSLRLPSPPQPGLFFVAICTHSLWWRLRHAGTGGCPCEMGFMIKAPSAGLDLTGSLRLPLTPLPRESCAKTNVTGVVHAWVGLYWHFKDKSAPELRGKFGNDLL